jgi:hypothetical protein
MAFNPFPSQVSPVEINDLPEKVSPVGNDEIQISDSENSNAAKKIKISSLPSGSGGGATSLDQLTDVSVPTPTNGQALVYNNTSSQWEAQTISSGGGVSSLDELTDVALAFESTGQVLLYSGASWVNSTLSKSSVGLSNVDNTSDINKPVSTATQTALNLKYNASNPSNYVNAAGAAAAAPVQSVASKTGAVTLVKGDVGLSNVDNTSDLNKPISTATQNALNNKENSITAGTTSQYFRGDKTFQTLDKSSVGLSDVDNTSDVDKPISSATQTALDAKQATLVSSTNIKTINGSSVLGSGDLIVTVPAYTVSQILALDINWNSAGIFYKDISANSTFTFSNVTEGKAISVILTNTGASSITITFPSGIFKELGAISIAASSAAVFSFIRANSKTYLASLRDLTNL